MTKSNEQKRKIEVADQSYVNAVFDALMTFQAIEDLLKKCILMSYEIIKYSCSSKVSFNPSPNQIMAIKNRLGLGGLAEKFKEVTPHKNTCETIQAIAKTRNILAHRAAADYLTFPISHDGASLCQSKAEEFQNATEEANKLYYKLIDIYNQIKGEHGEIV